ncbi:MAG: acyl carrier protein [Rhodocyclaceae bacterium]
MTEDDILARLTPLFREVFQDHALTATPSLTADDVERWDSLSHVDMIMLVEEAFSIRVPTREVTRMKNVGDLVRVIQAAVR